MNRKNAEKRSGKAKSPHWVRASISFPAELYETLEEIAKQKKVSLAWVVRDASEKYVSDETAESRRRQRQTLDAAGKLTRRAT
jgi:metal-responsive CopG/Arc/MetJ family transcriptional regulator